MPKENEVDKFFEGLPSEETKEVNIFDGDEQKKDETTPAAKQEGEETPEKGSEPRKNRRHRRLEQQLQEERELRIAAEARAEGRTEAQRFSQETASDVPEKWLRMYGDTPEARQAWLLQKELLADVISRTKAETIAEIEERQAKAAAAEREFEKFIENELEALEDEHDVDLTSDAPAAKKARREFLELVQGLSPKDESGSITGYADFDEAFKVYQQQTKKPAADNSRQKEIASRGLARSGDAAGAEKPKARTPGFFGWQKDLNIDS